MAYRHEGSWSSWLDAIGRLQEQAVSREKDAEELRLQLHALKERIDRLEARPVTTIERVEYKFDQLKVERLDGALHIGMPVSGSGQPPAAVWNGDSDGMDMSVNAGQGGAAAVYPAPGDADPAYREALDEVSRYLDEEAAAELERLEGESGLSLDAHHRAIVVADLRRQAGPRLLYYLQAARASGRTGDTRRFAGEAASLAVADLAAAMRNYLSRLKG